VHRAAARGGEIPGRVGGERAIVETMHASFKICVCVLLVACGPGSGKDPGTTDATAATGTTVGTTAETTAEMTAGTTTGTTAVTPTTASPTTTASSESVGDESSGLECAPQGLPACPVAQCIEFWSYDCPNCDVFFDTVRCFELGIGCSYPLQHCSLPMPCDRVWGTGYDAITGFESEEAAICMLTALRDGTPGNFEVLWGEMGDEGINYMEVYSGGKDTVYIEWDLDCQGCPESGALGRSGQLTLQPDSYFDACLAMPDTASLIQCVFGFVDFAAGSPPPADFVPAFTTGQCASLDAVCPG